MTFATALFTNQFNTQLLKPEILSYDSNLLQNISSLKSRWRHLNVTPSTAGKRCENTVTETQVMLISSSRQQSKTLYFSKGNKSLKLGQGHMM